MIDTKTKFMERFIQKRRFNKIMNYLHEKDVVLDFGGNEGELGKLLKLKDYVVCNYDYSVLNEKKFTKIVMLAVLEHIELREVAKTMKMLSSHLLDGGYMILTTPTPLSKPILEIMSRVGLTDRANIIEHKHYWNESELRKLAKILDLEVVLYKKFQLGMNQILILRKVD